MSSNIIKSISILISSLLVSLFSIYCHAEDKNIDYKSPVGIWKTIDDETGDVKSIVTIEKRNNELTGKVVKILKLSPDVKGTPDTVKCLKCTGANKDKLIKGMTILWGVSKDGNEWTGGKILDPKTGSIYSVKLYLDETGKKLNVRGFIGFSLLGRTQVWQRLS